MGSREQHRTGSELLRRSLADAGGAPSAESACPAPEVLAAYHERSLDAAEKARCELHFSQCARCREQLAALTRADESATAQTITRRPATNWAWLWNWRWLAPATAAALVLAIVLVAHHPAATRTAQQKSPTLVAEYRPTETPAPPAQKSLPQPPIAASLPPAGTAPALHQSVSVAAEVARNEPPQPAPAAQPTKSAIQNLPMNGRNYTEALALDKVNQASAPGATQETVAGSAGPGIAANAQQLSSVPAAPPRVPAASQQVVVTAAQEPIQTEASAVALSEKETVSTNAAKTRQGAASSAQTRYSARMETALVQNAERPSNESLIRTPDPNVLWRVTSAGLVERSLDGGATWQKQPLKAQSPVVAGSAPSANVCWLVGHKGIIMLTRDGTSWKTIPPPVQADFGNVAARDASSATVTASDGRRFTTSDRGKHWTPLP